MDLPAAGQPADPVSRHVLAGVDRGHPRRLGRGAGVEARDPRIGVRAAQDIGVELARAIDVVGIGALSGQEAVILAPANRRSDLCHDRYSAAALVPFMAAAPALIA